MLSDDRCILQPLTFALAQILAAVSPIILTGHSTHAAQPAVRVTHWLSQQTCSPQLVPVQKSACRCNSA